MRIYVKKIILKGFFLSHIEKILSYPFIQYLNKKGFLSYIEKTQFFFL